MVSLAMPLLLLEGLKGPKKTFQWFGKLHQTEECGDRERERKMDELQHLLFVNT